MRMLWILSYTKFSGNMAAQKSVKSVFFFQMSTMVDTPHQISILIIIQSGQSWNSIHPIHSCEDEQNQILIQIILCFSLYSHHIIKV